MVDAHAEIASDFQKGNNHMKGRKTILTQEQERWLAERYPVTKNAELAERLGVSWRTVVRLAHARGLAKSREFIVAVQREGAEAARVMNSGEGNKGKANLLKYGAAYRFKPGVSSVERLGEDVERERLRKAHEKRNATIRRERVRIKWGLPQLTKMRLVSNRKHRALRYALKKRGYIVARASTTAFYDDSTDRSLIVERHATAVGFKIFKKD